MAFFDNLKKKTEDIMDKGTDKAKEVAEITKLNRNISAEEKQIQNAYLELGKAYFEREKDNYDALDKEVINKIKVSMVAIEEMKNQIAQLKGKEETEEAEGAEEITEIVCPKCNQSVGTEDKFCPKCGEKLVQE